MSDLIRGTLSFFLISIPEVAFMTLLLIRFMGRKELLDRYRFQENLRWYFVLIVPPSLLMDVLNYGFKLQQNVRTITCLILLYILASYVFDKTDHDETKWLKTKTFLCLIPLYFSLAAIELLTAPVWFYFLNLTYTEIIKNFNLVLLCSVSSRIIEFTVMIIILTNRNSKFQIKLVDYIYRNVFFRRFAIMTMISLLAFELYVIKIISYNNLLNIFQSLIERIFFVTLFTYLIPFLILTSVYVLINYCVAMINSGKQTGITHCNVEESV